MESDRVAAEVEELLPDYLADARECLDKVSEVLLAVDRGEQDADSIAELFRQMHIIKGGSGLMGLPLVGSLAHAAEDLLGAVKRGELTFGPHLAPALLGAHDGLRALLDELEAQGQTASDPSAAIAALRAAQQGAVAAAPDAGVACGAPAAPPGEESGVVPDRVAAEVEELLPDYLEDARECLDKVSEILLAVDRGEHGDDAIGELFRQMHIIKGGSGLMGLPLVGSLAHAAEDLLGAVKRGELTFGPHLAPALLGAHDGLRALLDELEAGGCTTSDPASQIVALEAARHAATPASDAPQPPDAPQAPEAPQAPPEPPADPPPETPPSESPQPSAAAATVDQADEVVQEFFIESRELVEELDQDLVTLEETPDDVELLNKIFRGAHTLKGSSSFLGFTKIAEVTHRVEDIFNKLRRSEMTLVPEAMDVVLEAVDRVRRLLESAQTGSEGPAVDDLLTALRETSEGGVPTVRVATDAAPAPAAAQTAAPEPVAQKTPAAGPVAAQGSDAGPAQQRFAPAEQTIRVDVERLDSLMNLVGELVLAKNRLARLRGDIEGVLGGHEVLEDLGETSSQIDLVASDLQLAVMKTRLVPIDKVFRKFPRMVRDLARSLKKDIRLEIQGANTELDKSVVEVIGDPLVHLIRNSADHGVEEPEERLQAGKPREGRVRLSARHEGNHIVVSIEDDGRGMDAEALKAKAVERGILSAQEAAAMSKKEAYNLIFAPGFSTAKKVTNVSGRGVGMDVVKTNIQQLNGLIDIHSELGAGTRVDVRIPLTLAIIQALLVRTGPEIYAVPLVSVVETVRVNPADVKTVDQFPVLRLRDHVMPLLRIDDLFRVPRAGHPRPAREYVVVLGLAEKRVGLVVDGLVGEEEVVIKNLGKYLSDTPGIAGATIRGDGRVTLIVDVNQVLEIATRNRTGRAAA